MSYYIKASNDEKSQSPHSENTSPRQPWSIICLHFWIECHFNKTWRHDIIQFNRGGMWQKKNICRSWSYTPYYPRWKTNSYERKHLHDQAFNLKITLLRNDQNTAVRKHWNIYLIPIIFLRWHALHKAKIDITYWDLTCIKSPCGISPQFWNFHGFYDMVWL